MTRVLVMLSPHDKVQGCLILLILSLQGMFAVHAKAPRMPNWLPHPG